MDDELIKKTVENVGNISEKKAELNFASRAYISTSRLFNSASKLN